MSKGDQSKFMSSAEKMKADLGPALCLAKWKQVSLHLQTGMNNSCYHPPLHPIDPVAISLDPSALHNTEHKKAQRVMMLQQQKPAECQYCWNMEAEDKLSDRHYRSGEPWAAVDFEKIKNSTGEENDVVPSYVEVNFNNACNLKCSYCSPQFSSSWADEAQRMGPYPTSTPHNNMDHFTGNRRIIPARVSTLSLLRSLISVLKFGFRPAILCTSFFLLIKTSRNSCLGNRRHADKLRAVPRSRQWLPERRAGKQSAAYPSSSPVAPGTHDASDQSTDHHCNMAGTACRSRGSHAIPRARECRSPQAL